MSPHEVILCQPVRSAIGTCGGALKDMPAPALGAAVIREKLKRSGLAADKVQQLIMGKGGMENMDRARTTCRKDAGARAWAT